MADADLACQILDKYPATGINKCLYFYRIWHDSLMRKSVIIRELNLHKFIGRLSEGRRRAGIDYLEAGNHLAVCEFMDWIEKLYSLYASLFYQYNGFF